MRKFVTLTVLLCTVVLVAANCTLTSGISDSSGGSGYTVVDKKAKGEATGFYLLGLIPLTDEPAGQKALKNAKGSADGLVNATMTSTTINLFIVEIEIIRVNGTSVKK